jgi:hypothetical protein
MRVSVFLGAVVFTFSASSEKVAIPARDNVGVYQNEFRKIFEKPLFQVNSINHLSVVESKENHLKVMGAFKRQGESLFQRCSPCKYRQEDYRAVEQIIISSVDFISFLLYNRSCFYLKQFGLNRYSYLKLVTA